MLDAQVSAHFDSLKKKSVILYGIETHVCIRQTALDLLERDCNVHLVIDATSSMNHHDRNIALQGMAQAGVTMISFQSLVFELLRTAEHPLFKEFLPILKDSPADPMDWQTKL